MGLVKVTLPIGGMTCVNCQKTIEKGLRKTIGVREARVSYEKETAEVTYDDGLITRKAVELVIKNLGYEVLNENRDRYGEVRKLICILVLILFLYLLLQHYGILNLLVPSRLADTGMSYGMLFVIGLITSVHCIAMCGGINLSQCISGGNVSGARQRAYSESALGQHSGSVPTLGQQAGSASATEQRPGGVSAPRRYTAQASGARLQAASPLRTFLPAVLYNLGRIISYTTVGFLLGLVGLLAGGTGTGLSSFLQGILKLITGLLMVIMGINMLGIFPWLRRFQLRLPDGLTRRLRSKASSVLPGAAAQQRNGVPLLVGLLNGLMPCGPLQSMQLVALASGSPISGALSMLMFSLGTVPLMLGLGSLVAVLSQKYTRLVMRAGSMLVVVLGLAMLSQGGSLSGLLDQEQLLFLILLFFMTGIAASIPFRRKFMKIAAAASMFLLLLVAAAGWSSYESTAASQNGAPSAQTAAAGATAAAGNVSSASGQAQGTDGAPSSSGSVAGTNAEASAGDGMQVITSTLSVGSYPNITVQAGVPVKWIIDAPEGSINGCNYKVLIRDFGIEYAFQEGENVIEFTPTEPGTYPYTCWMGMLRGNIFVTDSGAGASAASGVETGAASGESASGEDSARTAGGAASSQARESPAPSASADIPVPAGYVIPAEILAIAGKETDANGAQTQSVTITLTEEGFSPAVIVVESGVETSWTIQNERSNAEGLLAPYYSTALTLGAGKNQLYLYPTDSFEVYTQDGRFFAYVKVVEDLDDIDESAIREETGGFETLIYPQTLFESSGSTASCCG